MASTKHVVGISLLICCFVITLSSGNVGSRAEDPVPAAKEIVERALKAMGGIEAIRAIESAQYTVTSAEPKSEYTYFVSGETRAVMRTVTNEDHATTMEYGDNGEIGWGLRYGGKDYLLTLGPVGSLQNMRPLMFLHRLVLDLQTQPVQLEVVGRERWEDQDAWRLNARNKDNESTFYYFDAQTGLLLAIEVPPTQKVPFGTSVYRYRDWQQTDAIRLCKTIVVTNSQTKLNVIWTVATAEFNNVDPAVFTPPPGTERLRPQPKKN